MSHICANMVSNSYTETSMFCWMYE